MTQGTIGAATLSTPVGGRGWIPQGGEANAFYGEVADPARADLKESLTIGRDFRTGDAGDAEEHSTNGSRVKNLAEKIEALKEKRGEYAAYLSALEKSGESQISLTDPDSRAMAAHTKVGVGYNAQIAVDAKHKMIVAQAVSNDVLDMGLLQQTAEPARQILDVEKIDVVADKGYFRTEDIAACEKAGLMPHVPKPQRGPAVASGFFRKDEFRRARRLYLSWRA